MATVNGGTSGQGTVFTLTPPSNGQPAWTESVLHSFTFGDGAAPKAGLNYSHGTFFGTAELGGNNNNGTVFKLTPDGTYTVLYSFCSLPQMAMD